MTLKAKEFLSNLKNWDFEFLGKYKIDKNESQDLIAELEDLQRLRIIEKEMKKWTKD